MSVLYEIIPFVVILLLLSFIFYMDHVNRKERAFHLNFIDRLQNKLMARDLTEYSMQAKERVGRTVSNPLMTTIEKNNKARHQALHGEDQDDG